MTAAPTCTSLQFLLNISYNGNTNSAKWRRHGVMFATQTSDVRNVRINLIWDTALSGNGQ